MQRGFGTLIPKWDVSKNLPSRFRELRRRESGKRVRSVGNGGYQENEACRHDRTGAHELIHRTVAASLCLHRLSIVVPVSRHKLLSLTQNWL